LLSACGKDDDGGKGDGGSGGKKTYTIGIQAPLSADNAQLGINVANGVIQAVKEANAKGDLPFKLKTLKSDDEGDPAKGTAAAQKLIDDKSIPAVVGPVFSGPTKTASPLYARANLMSLTPSATNPALTDPANKFTSLVRGIANDNLQGKAIANFVSKKLKLKSIYVVDDKSEYGVGLSEAAIKDFKKAGLKVKTDSVPAKTPDYTGPATKAVNAKMDALFYAGYYQDAAPFAKKLKAAGWDKPSFSADGTKDQKFIDLGGAATENWYLTCPCTDATVEPGTKKFAADYVKMWKIQPGTYSGEAYDVTNFLISEMKKLGDKAGDRKAVLDAVKGATYKGLTKTFSFDKNGEFKGTDVWIYQVKNKKIGFIGNVQDQI
jgi:branched-chain amino acid transport system substrate-binding protein